MTKTFVSPKPRSLYIGTKMVLATPMNQSEFVDLMATGALVNGVTEVPGEDNDRIGFMVEVPEGRSNHIAYAGHISWVPFDEFSYRHLAVTHMDNLPPFLTRLLCEQAQLEQRLKDLVAFTKEDRFLNQVTTQRELLLEQCRVMYRLSSILGARINGHLVQIAHKQKAEEARGR